MQTKAASVERENFGQLMQELKQPRPEQPRPVLLTDSTDIAGAPAKPDRVPGGKRSAQFQRKYAQAVKAVTNGVIRPEVKPIADHVACSTRTASSILSKAVQDDCRFSRDTRGRVTFAVVT